MDWQTTFAANVASGERLLVTQNEVIAVICEQKSSDEWLIANSNKLYLSLAQVITSNHFKAFDTTLISELVARNDYARVFGISLTPLLIAKHQILEAAYTAEGETAQDVTHEQQERNIAEFKVVEACLVALYNSSRAVAENEQRPQQAPRTVSQKLMEQLYQSCELFQKTYENTFNFNNIGGEIRKCKRVPEINALNVQGVYEVLLNEFSFYSSAYSHDVFVDYLQMVNLLMGTQVLQDDLRNRHLVNSESDDRLLLIRVSPSMFQEMILTLFGITVTRKQLEGHAKSMLNLLLKKTSNECQFRLASLTESVSELIDDDFGEIFQ